VRRHCCKHFGSSLLFDSKTKQPEERGGAVAEISDNQLEITAADPKSGKFPPRARIHTLLLRRVEKSAS
jgi:hypothetical protein